jgi:hypothetical protein
MTKTPATRSLAGTTMGNGQSGASVRYAVWVSEPHFGSYNSLIFSATYGITATHVQAQTATARPILIPATVFYSNLNFNLINLYNVIG